LKKYFVEKAFFSELFARFVSEKTPGCLVRPHGKPPAVKLRVKGFVAVAVGIGVLAIVGFVISHFVVEEAPYSNIHPEDYVGPETCGSCHEKNYEMWKDHSHRKMNLTASEESVLGDFSGIELQYGRGHAKFHRVGTDFVMSIFEGGRMTRRHKVTRTVGSLYMQYYVGTQVFGPEPKTHLTYKLESKLPFAYLFPTESWVPEVYLDSTSEPDELYLNGKLTDYIYDQPPVHNWNTTCMTCHNTYPYIMRLWHLPPPYDEDGLWQGGFPESDVSLSGPSLHQGGLDLGGGVRATHPDELVTVGISCESCHFGGREHAINGREIRFVPTGPEVSVATSRGAVKSDRKDPYVVNSICRQCHNSELLLHPNQASAINSDEAMDLSRGACKSEIKCTDCHNPHRRGPGSGAPDQPQHIAACLRCHEKFKEPGAYTSSGEQQRQLPRLSHAPVCGGIGFRNAHAQDFFSVRGGDAGRWWPQRLQPLPSGATHYVDAGTTGDRLETPSRRQQVKSQTLWRKVSRSNRCSVALIEESVFSSCCNRSVCTFSAGR
jgi:hypothetical protein